MVAARGHLVRLNYAPVPAGTTLRPRDLDHAATARLKAQRELLVLERHCLFAVQRLPRRLPLPCGRRSFVIEHGKQMMADLMAHLRFLAATLCARDTASRLHGKIGVAAFIASPDAHLHLFRSLSFCDLG